MPRIPQAGAEKVESQLTPMIDIVFQLLIFFILTFKVVVMEGQFAINIPKSTAQAAAVPTTIPPLTVRLEADGDGELKDVSLGARSLGTDMSALQYELEEAAGIGMEVEIDSDPALQFKYIIDTINICSRVDITSIKFAASRQEGGT